MRWLAVWILLTGVYFAGQLAAPLVTGGSWGFTRESLAHLVLVPLAQVAALWMVALVRRHVRDNRDAREVASRRSAKAVTPPPPAPERSASRPDEGP
jgi:hypothetical protein